MMPAVVLTAGHATRLRPLSLVRAKAACPVAGQPLVRRILHELSDAGVTRAVLNLHHLPHTITGALGDGSDLGLRIRYSWESPVLGSAGGPRRAMPLLDRDADGTAPRFFVVNGDTLTDVDFERLAQSHRASGALVTMAVVPNTQPGKYGGVAATEDGIVTGFVPRASREPSCHFVGVQAVEADAFATVPPDVPVEVRTHYPALMRERPGAVRVFRCEAECLDIGTPSDYLATSLLLATRETNPASLRGARCTVHPSARISESVLWDDVTVEAGAALHECIVTDGVRVPAGTSWRRAILRVPDGGPGAGERLVHGLAVGEVEPGGTGE